MLIRRTNFMKCPNCGAELPEGAKFCSQCGYYLSDKPLEEAPVDPAHELRNTATVGGASGSAAQQTTPIERGTPEFNNNVKRAILFSGLGFVGAAISLLGSLLMKFVDMGGTEIAVGLPLLMAGAMTFAILMFGFAVPLGKKTIGTAQPKGFKENVPGIFMGFGMVMVFGALFLQGILLIIS